MNGLYGIFTPCKNNPKWKLPSLRFINLKFVCFLDLVIDVFGIYPFGRQVFQPPWGSELRNLLNLLLIPTPGSTFTYWHGGEPIANFLLRGTLPQVAKCAKLCPNSSRILRFRIGRWYWGPHLSPYYGPWRRTRSWCNSRAVVHETMGFIWVE